MHTPAIGPPRQRGRWVSWIGAFVAGLATCVLIQFALAQEKTTPSADSGQPTSPDTKQDRIKTLQTLLSGSRFVGHFTVDADPQDKEAKPTFEREEYEIKRATKLPAGNLWLIEARIHYGEHDVTVPIPIPIEWAGETAVISVNKLNIPGLGTFDARVVIDGKRYAGTWQHDGVGGHLFGSIERAEKSPP
jgi:hypothetical protein